MTAPDLTSQIARYWCETPTADLAGGAKLTTDHVVAELLDRFPTATLDEFKRGCAIADELMRTDRRFAFEMEITTHPCSCGRPGFLVMVDDDHVPTGERRCVECDLIEAAKIPCKNCGSPMVGEDVRAGVTLCETCDPDEIGWEGAP